MGIKRAVNKTKKGYVGLLNYNGERLYRVYLVPSLGELHGILDRAESYLIAHGSLEGFTVETVYGSMIYEGNIKTAYTPRWGASKE